MNKLIKKLNKLSNEMLGKPMNKEQKEFLEELRAKINSGKITIKKAHDIWDKKYYL